MRPFLPWILIAAALAAVVLLALPTLRSGSGPDAEGEDATASGAQGAEARARLQGRGVAGQPVTEGGVAIRGRVVDAQDRPLPGEIVWLSRLAEPGARARLAGRIRALEGSGPAGSPLGQTTTDAQGRFAFPLAAGEGPRVRVEVHALPPRCAARADVDLRPALPPDEVVLRLLEGSRLEGRVVDVRARGVLARVSAVPSGRGGGAEVGPTDTSLPAGSFAFEALPAGTCRLDVTVPGRLVLRGIEVDLPHAGLLTIELPSDAGRIHGTVRGEGGAPLAGATVLLDVRGPDGRTATVSAATQEGGRYALDEVPVGRVVLASVLAEDHLLLEEAPPLARWSGARVAAGEDTTLDLALLTGAAVDGRVTDADSGAPLEGAQVYVAPPQGARGDVPHATSGADGRFRVEGVAPGVHLLVAVHPTHFQPELEQPRHRTIESGDVSLWVAVAPAALELVIHPSDRVVHRELALRRGGAVRGRVLGPDGTAVAGAGVNTLVQGVEQRLGRFGFQVPGEAEVATRTDAQGRFVIGALPPSTGLVLLATRAPLVGIPSAPLVVGPEIQPPEVVLRLEQSARIVGRVLGADGQGLSSEVAALGMHPVLGEVWPVRWQATGPDGSFCLEDLPPGTAHLWAKSDAFGHAEAVVEDLRAGEVREGVELRVAAGVRVSGVLVDADGRAVPRQRLMLTLEQTWYHFTTRTDASGAFVFGNVPEGQGRIVPVTEDPSRAVALEGGSIRSPAEGLRLVLESAAAVVVEGVVLDPQGRRVPLVRVVIGGSATEEQDAFSTYGHFDVEQVVGGEFRRALSGSPPYTVEVREARDAEGRDLNLRPWRRSFPTAPDAPLEIRLEQGRVIEGRVVDPEGAGIPEVLVSAPPGVALTDQRGRFSLGGFGEGEAHLEIQVPPGWVTPPSVSAAPGREALVRLERAQVVAGVVLDDADRPLPSAWVRATWTDAQGASQDTAADVGNDGRFRLEGIPPGVRVRLEVLVHSWDAGGTDASRVLEDVEAGRQDVVVRFSQGVSIEGTVKDAAGKPFSVGVVTLELARAEGLAHPLAPSAWVLIQADGTFQAVDLEPGASYRITVSRQDGGPPPAALVVVAPATGVRIVMPEGRSIAGRLLGPGDLSGYGVTAFPVEGREASVLQGASASDGRFRIDHLAPGTYRIFVRKDGSDLYAVLGSVEAGTLDAVVALEQGLALAGRLRDADGRPVARGQVVVQTETLGSVSAAVVDGAFRVTGLPPGRHTLQGGVASEDRGFSVSYVLGEFEAGRTDLDLRLP